MTPIFRTLSGKDVTIQPMDRPILHLTQDIHDAHGRVVMVTAGAGTEALSWLLGVAGASRTLLEAIVPYSEGSFNDFLGRPPLQYVAGETAACLAGRALSRARQLYPNTEPAAEPLIGLACTATIATDRPKKGEHRAHVATWRLDRVSRYGLQLQKGARDRLGEEELVSRLILNALAHAFQLETSLDLPLSAGDDLTREESDLATAAQRLAQGDDDYFAIRPDGHLDRHTTPPVILSGAFNPLHDGHLGLARVAAEILGAPVAFEVAAVNADKPPLEPEVLLTRLAQFAGNDTTVYTSRAPTYREKARFFPGTTFVVGYDTAVRILQPRYYDNNIKIMTAALSEIDRQGCRFLVAGRTDSKGQFHEAGELVTPEQFAHLFQPIPPGRFRRDISSTELRGS